MSNSPVKSELNVALDNGRINSILTTYPNFNSYYLQKFSTTKRKDI